MTLPYIDRLGRLGVIGLGAAIDYLEQTNLEHLNPNNILDAEGIKKITELTATQAKSVLAEMVATGDDPAAAERGFPNLEKHIENVTSFGAPVVPEVKKMTAVSGVSYPPFRPARSGIGPSSGVIPLGTPFFARDSARLS